jgi:PP-loop superfamily ATP-utilizing enzyme
VPFQDPPAKPNGAVYVDHEPALDEKSISILSSMLTLLVYVAMSGGVDSSLAAALLKKKVSSLLCKIDFRAIISRAFS